MNIELTNEQSQAIAAGGEPVILIDPRTKQTYRLISEDAFKKIQAILYDDSPWTPEEMGILAAQAFGKLDDTDYSEYLQDDK
jgi:hypothetical protein